MSSAASESMSWAGSVIASSAKTKVTTKVGTRVANATAPTSLANCQDLCIGGLTLSHTARTGAKIFANNVQIGSSHAHMVAYQAKLGFLQTCRVGLRTHCCF